MGKLSEAQVDKQIRDYLKIRGWRRIRHQRAVIAGAFQAGESGIPDAQYLRYFGGGVALILWIETKRPGDRRQCTCAKRTRGKCTVCAQAEWRRVERARGALVWVISSIEQLMEAYEQRFAWLHTGEDARGQLDLLAGVPVGTKLVT